jgi:hypothetical protein
VVEEHAALGVGLELHGARQAVAVHGPAAAVGLRISRQAEECGILERAADRGDEVRVLTTIFTAATLLRSHGVSMVLSHSGWMGKAGQCLDGRSEVSSAACKRG